MAKSPNNPSQGALSEIWCRRPPHQMQSTPGVLHFGRFYDDQFGGLERHVHLLCKGLAAHLHVANLVARTGPTSDKVQAEGFEIHRAATFCRMAGVAISPSLIIEARSLWRTNKFGIAHLHFPDPLSHLAATLLPRDAKVVITWHSDIIRQRKLRWVYQPLLDQIVRRASVIIAATPLHFKTSTQLSAIADRQKLRVIHYGIETDRYAPTASLAARIRKIRERHGGKPLVFSVGRHVYYKGFEYLLRAIKKLDARLLLGGTGPLHDAYRREAQELQLGDKVVFLGRVSDEDLPAYYHAADLFCMPSVERSEAFGLVQIEAMACGKPVVSCELHNGVTYVNRHGKTGLVVPPRDPDALADAIETLIRDPALAGRLGAAGRDRIVAEFSAAGMVESHLALYRELL